MQVRHWSSIQSERTTLRSAPPLPAPATDVVPDPPDDPVHIVADPPDVIAATFAGTGCDEIAGMGMGCGVECGDIAVTGCGIERGVKSGVEVGRRARSDEGKSSW